MIVHDWASFSSSAAAVSVAASSYQVSIGRLDPSQARIRWFVKGGELDGVRWLARAPVRRRLTRRLVALEARHPFHCSDCLALINAGERFWSAGLLKGGLCAFCRSHHSPTRPIRSERTASSLAYVTLERPRRERARRERV